MSPCWQLYCLWISNRRIVSRRKLATGKLHFRVRSSCYTVKSRLYKPPPPFFCCFKLTERTVHYRNVLCSKTSKLIFNTNKLCVDSDKPSRLEAPSKPLTKLYEPRAYKWGFTLSDSYFNSCTSLSDLISRDCVDFLWFLLSVPNELLVYPLLF